MCLYLLPTFFSFDEGKRSRRGSSGKVHALTREPTSQGLNLPRLLVANDARVGLLAKNAKNSRLIRTVDQPWRTWNLCCFDNHLIEYKSGCWSLLIEYLNLFCDMCSLRSLWLSFGSFFSRFETITTKISFTSKKKKNVHNWTVTNYLHSFLKIKSVYRTQFSFNTTRRLFYEKITKRSCFYENTKNHHVFMEISN